jgi:hypothetical protein
MKPNFISEEIINSLEGIERAQPTPFLYTRVHARLIKIQHSPEINFFKFVTRPAFVLGVVLLIVFMNGYFMMNRTNLFNTQEEVSQSLAVEYGQNTPNPYDLNETP